VGSYVAKRVLSSVITLLIISFISFVFVALLPGSPAEVLLGEFATPQSVAVLTHEWGLDKPMLYRYGIWIGNVLRGNFGESLISRIPVRSLIARAWPVSVELCLLSLLIAIVVGMPLGVVTATARPATERAVMTSVLVAQSVPSFVSGILMILVLSVKLHWLPSSGYVSFLENPVQNLKVMIMPALSLGLVIAALLARFTRSCMLDALSADFVRTARAKGLKELTVLIRHAFRSAMIPVVSLLGAQLVWFLGGAIIQEIVFVLPGLGRAVVRSVMGRDFATIQAVVLLMATVAALSNLAIDVLYGLLDPRIRYD